MSHTPVIADDRHRYQVILRAHLVEPKHIQIYNALRQSPYGDGQVQTFHDHISLPDIGTGKVSSLPEASMEYYPDPDAPEVGKALPGLDANVPVEIDRVLHFHQFEPDSEYPNGLAYLMYGDMEDIFIDHHINRAPSFHSVAKLRTNPAFWTPEMTNGATRIIVPSKYILDVSPKLLPRVCFVDNSFHLIWLPPAGLYSPQDPLIRRDGTEAVYDVLLDDGTMGQIDVKRFIHFDIKLLNNRVVIT
jgi:hypothetical protein